MGITIEDFKTLANSTFKIIPTVYDDSLSYYEQMAAVMNNVLEAIAKIEELEIATNQYTDTEIAKLKAQILLSFADFTTQITADFNALTELQNQQYETMTNTINENYNDMAALNAQTNAHITTEILNVQNLITQSFAEYTTWLEDYLTTQLIGVKVVNYFTGEKVTVQTMFNYLAMFHVTDGITYSELAAKSITYQQLIDKLITYQNLITQGGILI